MDKEKLFPFYPLWAIRWSAIFPVQWPRPFLIILCQLSACIHVPTYVRRRLYMPKITLGPASQTLQPYSHDVLKSSYSLCLSPHFTYPLVALLISWFHLFWCRSHVCLLLQIVTAMHPLVISQLPWETFHHSISQVVILSTYYAFWVCIPKTQNSDHTDLHPLPLTVI